VTDFGQHGLKSVIGGRETMPRGKGIYDNENTDRVQRAKSGADQRENDSSESQDTPDVDSSETQEPPD
jgi:hypothetical protein